MTFSKDDCEYEVVEYDAHLTDMEGLECRISGLYCIDDEGVEMTFKDGDVDDCRLRDEICEQLRKDAETEAIDRAVDMARGK